MTLNPLYNIMVGGIKVKVSEGDLDAAKTLLEALDKVPFRNDEDEVIVCPNCKSTDLYDGFKSMNGPAGFLSGVISLLFGTYPLYFKSGYKCKRCGKEFSK